MELYEEVLIKALSQQRMEVTFPDLRLDAQALVGEKCYRALEGRTYCGYPYHSCLYQ